MNINKELVNLNDFKKIFCNKKLLQLIINKEAINEICPVFMYNSLKPKMDFCDTKIFGENRILGVPRNLMTLFGFPQYGIHCNAWSKKKMSFLMHFSVRSKKLSYFPGLHDNLIAGGQPIGISILKNFQKEAVEEAGLKKINFKKILKGRTTKYSHEHQKKIHSGIIFTYHYEVSEKKKFINTDGEVDHFISYDISNIYKILESKILKPNCIIPIADFFLTISNDFFPKKGILELKRIMNKNGRSTQS